MLTFRISGFLLRLVMGVTFSLFHGTKNSPFPNVKRRSSQTILYLQKQAVMLFSRFYSYFCKHIYDTGRQHIPNEISSVCVHHSFWFCRGLGFTRKKNVPGETTSGVPPALHRAGEKSWKIQNGDFDSFPWLLMKQKYWKPHSRISKSWIKYILLSIQ